MHKSKKLIGFIRFASSLFKRVVIYDPAKATHTATNHYVTKEGDDGERGLQAAHRMPSDDMAW